MRALLFRHRKLFALFAVIALWLSLFPVWTQWVTANPLDETIMLVPRGKISKEVRVVVAEGYSLNLVFDTAVIPFEQREALLGDAAYEKDGKRIPSGVRVPIRWTLNETIEGSVAASGEVDSFGTSAWSDAEIERRLGLVAVKPGTYVFTAEVMRDVPELSHVKTRLTLQLNPKASSTWQITLAWFGSMINLFVVWPVAIALALILLWRTIKHYAS
jgi:hypothetical protein